MPARRRIVATREDAGKRLDQVLAARVPDLSRRQARVLLDIGGVFVDGARVKVASRTVYPGQVIEANVGGSLERATKEVGRAARARDEQDLPAYSVVYEDADVCVVDKPAGLLTAPTPESDRQNLADLLARRDGSAGTPRTPGPPGTSGAIKVVHRIDLMTSGLLVFAKTDAANRALAEKLRVHDVRRAYVAVVLGAFPEARRAVELPVRGRRAVTHFEVAERFGDRATRLACTLETGRTHQIRIHARHVGHPILGDPEYGTRTAWDPPRMALHAARLGFEHPRTGEQVDFESPLPDELATWLERLRSTPPG